MDNKKIRIILADDFQLLREDMMELLNQQEDMEVVGLASSGKEVVELAKNIKYDLILMDIEMETIDAGIQSTVIIREDNPNAKIIFLTAHETENVILTAMGTGALDYIVKGCEEFEILNHIRSTMSGHPVMENYIREIIVKEYTRLQKSERSLLFFINKISNLTSTERELIKLLLKNYKVKEIAEIRSVEITTIKSQIKGILRKFGCSRSKEVVELIRNLYIEHLFE